MMPQFYPQRKFRGLVMTTITTLRCKLESDDEELIQAFLNTVPDLGHVGPHLHSTGIGCQELSAETSLRTKLEQITDVPMLLTNITEMESFRRTEMLPYSELVQWMNVLLPTPICTTQLKKQVKKTFDEMQNKQRNKGRDNGQRDSEEFLAAGFLTDDSLSLDGGICVRRDRPGLRFVSSRRSGSSWDTSVPFLERETARSSWYDCPPPKT